MIEELFVFPKALTEEQRTAILNSRIPEIYESFKKKEEQSEDAQKEALELIAEIEIIFKDMKYE